MKLIFALIMLFMVASLFGKDVVTVNDNAEVVINGVIAGHFIDVQVNWPTKVAEAKEKLVEYIVAKSEDEDVYLPTLAEKVILAEELGCDVPQEARDKIDAAIVAEENAAIDAKNSK